MEEHLEYRENFCRTRPEIAWRFFPWGLMIQLSLDSVVNLNMELSQVFFVCVCVIPLTSLDWGEQGGTQTVLNKQHRSDVTTKLWHTHGWVYSETREYRARWERREVWVSFDLAPLSTPKFEQLGGLLPSRPNSSGHHVIRLRGWDLVCRASMPSRVVLGTLALMVTKMVTMINSEQHLRVKCKTGVHWNQSGRGGNEGEHRAKHPYGAGGYRHGLAGIQALPADHLNEARTSSVF